ncbi:hypothetical protein Taro_033983 [Colocasia esculenta]|uniref:Uncharacterized protein n=1 Tax=Colocasia esculenta TaxID=4460 RepID=A0A843WAK1_COLES|nr:hypothetical protein [Colocasia esculenta]
MASRFSRSVSLPSSNPSSCSSSSAGKTYHVRSTSLPCQSHPLISHLEDEVRATREWQSAEPEGQSSTWLLSGLTQLERLHGTLDDLLQISRTKETLRCSTSGSSGLSERMLEDFLVFADAYGSFRSALVSVQELQSAAQVAVRRGDEARLSSVARSLKKARKGITHLSSALRDLLKSAEPAFPASTSGSSAEDAELAAILKEVKGITVSVSTVVFQGIAAVMASTVATVVHKSFSWRALRRLALPASSTKKKALSETDWAKTASEKLDGLKDCIMGLETGSERVFRVLMNTRVSLLNIMTP